MVLRGDGQGSLSAELVAADGTKSKYYHRNTMEAIHITDNAVDLFNDVLNLMNPISLVMWLLNLNIHGYRHAYW